MVGWERGGQGVEGRTRCSWYCEKGGGGGETARGNMSEAGGGKLGWDRGYFEADDAHGARMKLEAVQVGSKG